MTPTFDVRVKTFRFEWAGSAPSRLPENAVNAWLEAEGHLLLDLQVHRAFVPPSEVVGDFRTSELWVVLYRPAGAAEPPEPGPRAFTTRPPDLQPSAGTVMSRHAPAEDAAFIAAATAGVEPNPAAVPAVHHPSIFAGAAEEGADERPVAVMGGLFFLPEDTWLSDGDSTPGLPPLFAPDFRPADRRDIFDILPGDQRSSEATEDLEMLSQSASL